MSILLLRRVHFDIPFYTREQKHEVLDLLENLMYKFEDDVPMLIDEVEEFLRTCKIEI